MGVIPWGGGEREKRRNFHFFLERRKKKRPKTSVETKGGETMRPVFQGKRKSRFDLISNKKGFALGQNTKGEAFPGD